jgi:hypothetical protein
MLSHPAHLNCRYSKLHFILESKLSYHQKYSKKQEIVYQLIKYLHENEELGYRKISQKLNSWGVKTQRGN